jgi:site-specific recombinase XerD
VAGLAIGKAGSAHLLMRNNGRGWGKSEQQRPIVAACATARIDPPVNFHWLRYTYASRLAMKGVPLAVIATQLGLSDTCMVENIMAILHQVMWPRPFATPSAASA